MHIVKNVFCGRLHRNVVPLLQVPRNASKEHLGTEEERKQKPHLGIDEDGGWHNWPTYAFEIGPMGKSKFLVKEYEKRKASFKNGDVFSMISTNEPLVSAPIRPDHHFQTHSARTLHAARFFFVHKSVRHER